MRIGIDISVLCYQWDGIGTLVFDFLNYINGLDDGDQYFLYADRPTKVDLALDKRFTIHTANGNNHMLWLLFILPKYIKNDKLDFFWQPNFIFPFKIKNVKNIIHVHDMSAYAYTNYAPRNTVIAHKLFLKTSCKKAYKILAISNNGKKEIEHRLKVNPAKIKVIYIGKKMFPKGEDASESDVDIVLNKFGIHNKEYILFVGTLSPRKNANILIQAYLEYRKNGGKKKLMLAGNIAAKCEFLRDVINSSPYKNDIIFAGYVNDLEKRVLYFNAFSLLFPSRLEGFGYPLLEGMQAEIPVITSRVSCMPEIASDAAIYLDDIDDWKALSECIFRVETMNDDELKNIVKKGKERVDYFDNMSYLRKLYCAIHDVE